MLLVLDTNIVVAAMRSPGGASAEVLRLARRRQITLLANVALALEYEAICTMSKHVAASGLSDEDALVFVDAVIAMCEPVESHFMWRPQLRDPADEFILDAAANGRADIVTFNTRDFMPAATSFGVNVYAPKEVLKVVRHEKS